MINKNVNIAILLIQNPKTDINARNSNGETPLLIAVRNNLKEIVNLLINDERFDPKRSRLSYSFSLSKGDITNQLISLSFLDVNYTFFKNNKNIINPIRKTGLVISVENNDIDRVTLLINHLSFDKEKSDINSAIFTCAIKNNIIIFRLLIDLINNDVNICNNSDETLLLVAARNLSGDIIDDIFNNPKFHLNEDQIIHAFTQLFEGKIYFIRQNQPPKPLPINIFGINRKHFQIN